MTLESGVSGFGVGTVEVSNGRRLNVIDPDPASITLEAVAHSLSLNCRFNGHCDSFWSVASHTLLVSRRVHDVGGNHLLQLAALHHDDGEFACGDIPRPIKAMIPDFKVIEERVMDAILEGLCLRSLPVHCETVKDADNWALAQEAHELMPSRGEQWGLHHQWDGVERGLGGELPERVRAQWLRRHKYLVSKVKGE